MSLANVKAFAKTSAKPIEISLLDNCLVGELIYDKATIRVFKVQVDYSFDNGCHFRLGSEKYYFSDTVDLKDLDTMISVIEDCSVYAGILRPRFKFDVKDTRFREFYSKLRKRTRIKMKDKFNFIMRDESGEEKHYFARIKPEG